MKLFFKNWHLDELRVSWDDSICQLFIESVTKKVTTVWNKANLLFPPPPPPIFYGSAWQQDA